MPCPDRRGLPLPTTSGHAAERRREGVEAAAAARPDLAPARARPDRRRCRRSTPRGARRPGLPAA